MTWFKSSRFPKALCLCLVLLFVTELVVAQYVHRLRPPSLSAMTYKQYLMETAAQGDLDLIIFGDSRFMGLNAKLIAEEISALSGEEFTAYNYAMLNQGIRTYYLLLQKYLRNHAPPQYILFGAAPIGITGEWAADREAGRNEALHYLAQLYPLADLWPVLPLRAKGTMLTIKLERLSNLVLYRKALKQAISRPEYHFKDYLTPAVRFLDKNNGGLIIGGFIKITDEDVRQSQYFETPLTVDPEMDYWYRRFFDLARRHGIQVLLANQPITSVLFHKREENGSNDRYRALVARWDKEFENLHIIPPLLQPYPVEDFKDWHHLNLEGTYRYIDQLVFYLKKFYVATHSVPAEK